VAPIQGHKIPGHCNRYGDRLLCLPGEWPWRD
jgi:hypothetical protein